LARNDDPLTPPVLFLIFNRPDLTKRTFEAIREVQPSQLFIAADGPRSDRPDDVRNCDECRAIVAGIDWECRVQTLYRERNLGCREAVQSAITWFFSHVEEGIILEDDCLPDASFFGFCARMLELYRDDMRVMCITGNNFQRGLRRGRASYYFSIHNHCWGWATWRRAWELNDLSMAKWPALKESRFLHGFLRPYVAMFWEASFDAVFRGEIDTWDYGWTLSCWANSGLTVTPNVNLVCNMGFDERATHTHRDPTNFHGVGSDRIGDQLIIPDQICRDVTADQFTEDMHFGIAPSSPTPGPVAWPRRILKKFKQTLSRLRHFHTGRQQRQDGLRQDAAGFLALKDLPRYTDFAVVFQSRNLVGPDGPSAYYSYKEIFVDQIYGFECTSDVPRIVDCGANIGLSVIYFRYRFPTALITAIEADPGVLEYLKRNLQSFGLSDIDVVHCAVAGKNGEVCFLSEGADAGRIVNSEDSQVMRVEARSLDDFIEGAVDLLKLDIEGAETEALLNCTKLESVARIFVEYHSFADQPQRLDELLGFLRSQNFRISIHSQYASQRPFIARANQLGMDLQLNIFCWKPNAAPAK
jgi:FkbM family methyltransferase